MYTAEYASGTAILTMPACRTRRILPPILPMEQSKIPRRQAHRRAPLRPAIRAQRRRQRRQIQIRAIQHHQNQPRNAAAQQNRQPVAEIPHLDRQPGMAAQARRLGIPGPAPDRRAVGASERIPAHLRRADLDGRPAQRQPAGQRRRVPPVRRDGVQEAQRGVCAQVPGEQVDAAGVEVPRGRQGGRGGGAAQAGEGGEEGLGRGAEAGTDRLQRRRHGVDARSGPASLCRDRAAIRLTAELCRRNRQGMCIQDPASRRSIRQRGSTRSD